MILFKVPWHSFQCDISGTTWETVFRSATTIHLDSRMSWLNFGGHSSKVEITVTSRPSHACERDISGVLGGDFFKCGKNDKPEVFSHDSRIHTLAQISNRIKKEKNDNIYIQEVKGQQWHHCVLLKYFFWQTFIAITQEQKDRLWPHFIFVHLLNCCPHWNWLYRSLKLCVKHPHFRI